MVIVEFLAELFPEKPVATALSAADLARHVRSGLEAEELVDTLEMQGYLRFLGDTSERSVADAHWDISPHS